MIDAVVASFSEHAPWQRQVPYPDILGLCSLDNR